MSSPSSTQATHGSVKSSTFSKSSKGESKSSRSTAVTHEFWAPASYSSTFTPTSVDDEDLAGQRTADYLVDPINPNPGYVHSTSEESIHAHITSMEMYLDAFDKNMMLYDHKRRHRLNGV